MANTVIEMFLCFEMDDSDFLADVDKSELSNEWNIRKQRFFNVITTLCPWSVNISTTKTHL